MILNVKEIYAIILLDLPIFIHDLRGTMDTIIRPGFDENCNLNDIMYSVIRLTWKTLRTCLANVHIWLKVLLLLFVMLEWIASVGITLSM